MVHLIYCEVRGSYSPNKVSLTTIFYLLRTRISTGPESLIFKSNKLISDLTDNALNHYS